MQIYIGVLTYAYSLYYTIPTGIPQVFATVVSGHDWTFRARFLGRSLWLPRPRVVIRSYDSVTLSSQRVKRGRYTEHLPLFLLLYS